MADEIQELEKSVEIIQSLSTYPNREDGLTEEQMKEKFDAGAVILKQYLNDTVVPAIRNLQRALGTGEAIGIDNTLSKFGWAAESAAVGDILAKKLSAVESEEYPGCYYRMVGEEQEWLNPPMVFGVEHRTAERYNGKPVYIKRLKMDSLPNATYATVSYGVTGATVIDIQGNMKEGNYIYPFPYINNSGEAMAWFYSAANSYVQVWTKSDLSKRSAEFTVKYIKEA